MRMTTTTRTARRVVLAIAFAMLCALVLVGCKSGTPSRGRNRLASPRAAYWPGERSLAPVAPASSVANSRSASSTPTVTSPGTKAQRDYLGEEGRGESVRQHDRRKGGKKSLPRRTAVHQRRRRTRRRRGESLREPEGHGQRGQGRTIRGYGAYAIAGAVREPAWLQARGLIPSPLGWDLRTYWSPPIRHSRESGNPRPGEELRGRRCTSSRSWHSPGLGIKQEY